MGRRTVRVSVVVLDPRAFCAFTVTCLVTDCDGVPEMSPVLVFKVNPVESVPEVMEKTTDSPVNVGVAEKEALLGIV